LINKRELLEKAMETNQPSVKLSTRGVSDKIEILALSTPNFIHKPNKKSKKVLKITASYVDFINILLTQ